MSVRLVWALGRLGDKGHLNVSLFVCLLACLCVGGMFVVAYSGHFVSVISSQSGNETVRSKRINSFGRLTRILLKCSMLYDIFMHLDDDQQLLIRVNLR